MRRVEIREAAELFAALDILGRPAKMPKGALLVDFRIGPGHEGHPPPNPNVASFRFEGVAYYANVSDVERKTKVTWASGGSAQQCVMSPNWAESLKRLHLHHLTPGGWKADPIGRDESLETWAVTVETNGTTQLTRWACIAHSERLDMEERRALHQRFGSLPIQCRMPNVVAVAP